MKTCLLLALMVITNTVSAQLPADSIKAIINQEVANKRSKSIIVGIIDANGRRIYSEGMISDENPVPPDANTIYEIGSITKVFTSLVLADMSLKHQLDLDDPISKFLPKTVKTPTCSGKEISLRTLSTHRSGFSRNAYNLDPKNLDNPFTDYTVDQLYEYVSNFELTRDIDSKWGYSNIAYTLLGHILTIVADKELETLVAEDICKPLNLKSTVFSVPRSLRKNLAQGHTEYGEPTHAWDLLPLAGGGGQRSTVNDLLTFAACQPRLY
jgi:D-alanyl-D-alanine-carboxypeptidase/D-alanyl-D-alanine-endopeptidase